MVSKETVATIGGLVGSVILVWILASSFGMLPTSNRYKETFDTLEEGFYKAGKFGSAVVSGWDFFYYDSYSRTVVPRPPYSGESTKISIPTKKPNPALWVVQKHSDAYNYPLIIFVKSNIILDRIEKLKESDVIKSYDTALKVLDKDMAKLKDCESGYCMCYVKLYPAFVSWPPQGFDVLEFGRVDAIRDCGDPQCMSKRYSMTYYSEDELNLNKELYSASTIETYWDAISYLNAGKLFNTTSPEVFLKYLPLIEKCVDMEKICRCDSSVCETLDQRNCDSFGTFKSECEWSDADGVCKEKFMPACLPVINIYTTYGRKFRAVASISPDNPYWVDFDPKSQQIYIDKIGCVLSIDDMSKLNKFYLAEEGTLLNYGCDFYPFIRERRVDDGTEWRGFYILNANSWTSSDYPEAGMKLIYSTFIQENDADSLTCLMYDVDRIIYNDPNQECFNIGEGCWNSWS